MKLWDRNECICSWLRNLSPKKTLYISEKQPMLSSV